MSTRQIQNSLYSSELRGIDGFFHAANCEEPDFVAMSTLPWCTIPSPGEILLSTC